MKRQNTIFPAILLTLTTMPFSVFAIPVSGTVSDANEVLIGATIIALDSAGKKNSSIATVTDIDGHFELEVPERTKLQISHLGYKPQIIDTPTGNLNITLVEESKALDGVTVAGESDITGRECITKEEALKEAEKEAKAEYSDPKEIQEAIKRNSEKQAYLNDKYAVKEKKGKYKKVSGTWICVPNECVQDYELKNDVCVRKQCSNQEKKDLNADKAEYKGGKCIPTECKNKYHLENGECVENKCPTPEEDWINGGCIKVRCTPDEQKAKNATAGKWENNKCVPTKCDTDLGYVLNKEKKECEKGKCSKSEIDKLKQDKNVDTVELDEKGQCQPVCKKKYHLENGKCVENKCENSEDDWNGKECVKVRCKPDELKALNAKDGKWENNQCVPTKCDEKVYTLKNGICDLIDKRSDEEKRKALAEKQKAYDEAHAKEQSTANKTLTALTTAATGIGGMQLMQGMAEQSADKDATSDMAAYIETMRCTYGDGKQVKAGPEEIELPGANDQEMMKLRSEYLALAADLKERKEALGMKPGIESEVIVDRSATGLYDDENVGITSGNYASLYRAQALDSEADQAKIDDAKKTSANRVKGGAIAAGAGVVVGVAGNSLINGKLGEKLKEKNQGKALRAAVEIEKDALDDMKKCLKDAGVKDTDDMEFQNFYISVLSVKNINCKREITKINGETPSNIAAKTIFADSNNAEEIYNQLTKSFDPTIAGKMIGVTLSQQPTDVQKQNAISTLQSGIDKVTKRFQDAAKEDEKRLSSSGLKDFDIDFSSILSSFKGDSASSSIMDMVNNGFK